MPVDLYVGGAEHAVLHLLYSRFWHKVLFDRGVVSTPEPFQKLVNQGMILGENNDKMSKSRGNVVNPDDGGARNTAPTVAAAVRNVHGPAGSRPKPVEHGRVERRASDVSSDPRVADDSSTIGRARQMSTERRRSCDDVADADEQNRVLHKTIKAVTQDLDQLAFNTAIARMMEFTNFFTK